MPCYESSLREWSRWALAPWCRGCNRERERERASQIGAAPCRTCSSLRSGGTGSPWAGGWSPVRHFPATVPGQGPAKRSRSLGRAACSALNVARVLLLQGRCLSRGGGSVPGPTRCGCASLGTNVGRARRARRAGARSARGGGQRIAPRSSAAPRSSPCRRGLGRRVAARCAAMAATGEQGCSHAATSSVGPVGSACSAEPACAAA